MKIENKPAVWSFKLLQRPYTVCCWRRTLSLVINKHSTAPENMFHDLNWWFKSTIFINFSACALFWNDTSISQPWSKNLTLDISFLAISVLIPKIIIFYASFLRQMKGESMSKLSIHWWLLCRYEGHIEYSNSLFEKCIACCRTMLSLTNVAISLKARLETIQTVLWSTFRSEGIEVIKFFEYLVYRYGVARVTWDMVPV